MEDKDYTLENEIVEIDAPEDEFDEEFASSFSDAEDRLFLCPDFNPENLKDNVIKAMNELVGDIDIIKSNLMSKIEKLVNNETASSIQQLAEQLEEKQNSMMKLFKHKDTMPTEEYNKESNKLIEEISKINK